MMHYIGLDLGGTNIKAGVVDERANVLAHASCPTDADRGPSHVVDAMARLAQDVTKRAQLDFKQVRAIGIGAPGPLDFDAGTVKASPNLPGWKDVPLRDHLTKVTGRPTVLENDANAAAFGEFWAGAGRDPNIRNLVMLTLGTGIGTGVVIDGKVLHGAYGLGGEGGHMIVQPNGRPCGCGQRGCLEAYASASHTLRRTVEAIEAGQSTSLRDIYNRGSSELTSRDVFEAAKAGDTLATLIVDETVLYLGIGCVNACRWFDPQMIVFAGGMIHAGDFLFDKVRETFKAQSWRVAQDKVQIVPAQLGNDAGFIGAAAVAWDADRDGRLKQP